MNKKLGTIIAAILVLAVGGSIAYAVVQFRDNKAQEKAAQTPQFQTAPTKASLDQSKETTAPQSTAEPGLYADYSAEMFDKTAGRRVLFFYAPWCPQCRAIDADIHKRPAEVPSNTTIFKVNYDSNTALRQKYGVTLQTTFIEVDEKGDSKKKFVAYDTPNFTAILNAIGR